MLYLFALLWIDFQIFLVKKPNQGTEKRTVYNGFYLRKEGVYVIYMYLLTLKKQNGKSKLKVTYFLKGNLHGIDRRQDRDKSQTSLSISCLVKFLWKHLTILHEFQTLIFKKPSINSKNKMKEMKVHMYLVRGITTQWGTSQWAF